MSRACTDRGLYPPSLCLSNTFDDDKYKKENHIFLYIYIHIYSVAFTSFSRSFARSFALSPSLAYNIKSRYECLVHQRIPLWWHHSPFLSLSLLFLPPSLPPPILMQPSEKRKREQCLSGRKHHWLVLSMIDRVSLKGSIFAASRPPLLIFARAGVDADGPKYVFSEWESSVRTRFFLFLSLSLDCRTLDVKLFLFFCPFFTP